MVLARVGPMIDTASVILDPLKAAVINQAGQDCLERFGRKRDLYNLLDLSVDFTAASGLLTERVRKALVATDGLGLASMCMVGNSVFAAGPDLDALARHLSRYGMTFRTSVDLEGPRML